MIEIGGKVYKYKKEALNHYKSILNSYRFNDSLNENDFNNLIDLLEYNHLLSNEGTDKFDSEYRQRIKTIIIDIKIAKLKFETRCFEVICSDDSRWQISYISMINRTKYSPDSLFSSACRSAIQKDIWAVKKKYFEDNSVKGFVKCQETSELSKWEDLAVDHRQPNTFSVIVDRFKELNNIYVTEIEYLVDDENVFIFKDEILRDKFRNYHKEKANLRIVRKECNLSRTGMARIKRTNKDLTIK